MPNNNTAVNATNILLAVALILFLTAAVKAANILLASVLILFLCSLATTVGAQVIA